MNKRLMFLRMVDLLVNTCKRCLSAEQAGDKDTAQLFAYQVVFLEDALTAGLSQDQIDRAKAYTVYMTGGGAYDADGNPFVTPAEAEQSLRLLLEAAWQDSN